MAKPATNDGEKKDASNDNDKSIDAIFATYKERIEKFEDIVCEMPVDNNRIISDKWKEYQQETYMHMKRCYPLVHGSVVSLAYNFLLIKQKYGTDIEKKLYDKMTLVQFFDRLATKRCVVFYQSYDSYLLRNGYNDSGKWENIGTEKENHTDKYDVSPEKKPKLAEYLSYDELIISAMCGISSPTHFINNGDRRNCGRINEDEFGKDCMYPMQGIYMGLVGARFEKSGYMEYALMAVTNEQNKSKNGFGPTNNNNNDDNKQQEHEEGKQQSIEDELNEEKFMNHVDSTANTENTKIIWRAFEKFYSRNNFPLYESIRKIYHTKDSPLHDVVINRYFEKPGWGDKHPFLDIEMFKQRIKISMELFLFDANERAKTYKELYSNQLDLSKKHGAFCHVVGLGTGVWSFRKSEQDRLIVVVTKEIIESSHLEYIDCVYFSWMDEDCMKDPDSKKYIFNGQKQLICNDLSDNAKHEIIIDSGRRAPADEMENGFEQCLTVAMYAWDSNSFPGNEYYHGMLSASGDPAAASCSTISYIQNSEINTEYINGENTGIYFYDPKTNKYEFAKLGDMKFEENKEKWLKKSIMSIPYKRDNFINK